MANKHSHKNVDPCERRIKKLEEQIHYLVELLTEKQLDQYILYCENQILT
jgi:hypothetical protein